MSSNEIGLMFFPKKKCRVSNTCLNLKPIKDSKSLFRFNLDRLFGRLEKLDWSINGFFQNNQCLGSVDSFHFLDGIEN